MRAFSSPPWKNMAVLCLVAGSLIGLSEVSPSALHLPLSAFPQGTPPYNFRPKDERDAWQRVPDVFKAMNLQEGQHIADIGAGWGYFTTRLGHAVGPNGKVYAVDIDTGILEDLRKAVKKEGLTNVEVVVSKQDDPMLAPISIDAALIVNSYHEMTRYDTMLWQIFRALKPGGRLVILDRIDDKSRHLDRAGQTKDHFLGIGYAITELERAGFVIMEAHDPFTHAAGDTEWMIVGQRPGKP